MGWISRILGKGDEQPAPDEDPAGDETAPTPADAGDVEAGQARIVAGLRTHLAASAEEAGKPLEGVALQDDVDLYEAGYLDSLTASEFLVRAEKDFGVELPDWLLGGRANTLDSLARYIDGELSSR